MVYHLGALILVILDEFYHHCLLQITILVGTLQVLTLGRTPRQKLGKHWIFTKQVASLLLIHLRGMKHEDFARLGSQHNRNLDNICLDPPDL